MAFITYLKGRVLTVNSVGIFLANLNLIFSCNTYKVEVLTYGELVYEY